MQKSMKIFAITALVALIVGLAIGFIPQYSKNAELKQQIASLNQDKSDLQSHANDVQTRLTLTGFAARSAMVMTEADKNNFADAASDASSLFTSIRTFTNQDSDPQSKQELEQVLSVRDATITGLARADPSVKQTLRDIFLKLQSISARAEHIKS